MDWPTGIEKDRRMADPASEFLATWTLGRDKKAPLSRHEAEVLASEWETDAEDNGISREDLDQAAGDDLPAYLLRVFGEVTPDSADELD